MTAPEIVASTVRVFFAPVVPRIREHDLPLASRALRFAREEIAELSSSVRFGGSVLTFLLEIFVAALVFAVMAFFIALLGFAVNALHIVQSAPMLQVLRVAQYAGVALGALLFVNTAIRALVQLIRSAGAPPETSKNAA